VVQIVSGNASANVGEASSVAACRASVGADSGAAVAATVVGVVVVVVEAATWRRSLVVYL
jgi:hypothetical protein